MGGSARTGFLQESRRRVLVAPSLLACDFSRLGEEVRRAEEAGADLFHLDVMDGHFVPNLTVGPLAMKAVRPHTHLPVEAHLMISDPLKYAPLFAEAGADAISFHVEAVPDARAAARAIRALRVAVGVSLNPATPFGALEGLRGEVDFVLVMTVVPGFGGQKFMPGPLEKARRAAEEWKVPVAVDGGIAPDTAAAVFAAGARILVAGSAVFGGPDLAGRIAAIRAAAMARGNP
jgi:ribulose-phosphate 3-epimerase